LRRKQCGNKIKYADQTAAVAAIIGLEKKKSAFLLRSYKCKFCKKWHIGNHRSL